MENPELETIGVLIAEPQGSAYRGTGERGRRGGTGAGDRLDELAAWWATVAGAAPPRRVEHLWLARPSSAGPAVAEVLIRRFDAPREIPDAIDWGVAVADDAVDDGTDLVLLSLPDDVGRGDVWPVLAAHLLILDAVEAVGWPSATGLSDDDWMVRVAAIRDGLRGLRGAGHEPDPEQLLEQLASPALAAGTGLLLQTAARRTPVLLDGPGAAACALLAYRVARLGRLWWHATDAGADPLHERVLLELGLAPLTRLALTAEDGTAARIGLGLLETAIARARAHADGDPSDRDPAAEFDGTDPGDVAGPGR